MTAADFELLTRIIHYVGRQARLSPDDALDFGQTVHLKLLERNYEPIRQFSGRSPFKAYLTVVVRRMLLDWRRTQFGKWRASAAARQLGPAAVALERLMYRSGHTLNEAVQVMATYPCATSAAELEQLAARIPVRLSYRTVPMDAVETAATTDFDDPVELADDHEAAVAFRRRLRDALDALPRTERVLLDLRYRRSLRVPTIAAALNVDSKTLYRKCEKALRALRASLAANDPGCGSPAVTRRSQRAQV